MGTAERKLAPSHSRVSTAERKLVLQGCWLVQDPAGYQTIFWGVYKRQDLVRGNHRQPRSHASLPAMPY